jgi:hypothetical protein
MEADSICRVENVLPSTCVVDTSVTNALTRMLNALAQLSNGNTAKGSKSRTGQDGLTLRSRT